MHMEKQIRENDEGSVSRRVGISVPYPGADKIAPKPFEAARVAICNIAHLNVIPQAWFPNRRHGNDPQRVDPLVRETLHTKAIHGEPGRSLRCRAHQRRSRGKGK